MYIKINGPALVDWDTAMIRRAVDLYMCKSEVIRKLRMSPKEGGDGVSVAAMMHIWGGELKTCSDLPGQCICVACVRMAASRGPSPEEDEEEEEEEGVVEEGDEGEGGEGATEPSPSSSSSIVEEDDECPECLDRDVDVRLVPCSHIFCRECVLGRSSCPVCSCDVQGMTEVRRSSSSSSHPVIRSMFSGSAPASAKTAAQKEKERLIVAAKRKQKSAVRKPLVLLFSQRAKTIKHQVNNGSCSWSAQDVQATLQPRGPSTVELGPALVGKLVKFKFTHETCVGEVARYMSRAEWAKYRRRGNKPAWNCEIVYADCDVVNHMLLLKNYDKDVEDDNAKVSSWCVVEAASKAGSKRKITKGKDTYFLQSCLPPAKKARSKAKAKPKPKLKHKVVVKGKAKVKPPNRRRKR